jgi:Zn finger protein HypA/HybF involved in hydrogenase expression
VVCAACGSSELEVSGGDELVLESIQLQAPI